MELFGRKPYWKEERATESTELHHWTPMDGSRSEQPAKQFEEVHRKEIKAKRPMLRLRTITGYILFINSTNVLSAC